MKVYRALTEISLRDSTIAIGVFDGVHRGHQKVLRCARESASHVPNGVSLVLTFDRHPAELVAPAHAPRYITSLSQRIEMIEAFCPVDAALVIPFDAEFAALSAHRFVKDVLVDRLGATRILVGADFRYGRDRSGGVMDLEAAGDAYHFGVDVVHSVATHGVRVSSTHIRELIAQGELDTASGLLDHPFTIRGTVVEGKKLGRTIGFPTANLLPEQSRQLLPTPGVYAGHVRFVDGREGRDEWPAAISIGFNPTTDLPGGEEKIEAYIMGGFNSTIYGRRIDLQLIRRLRSEQKFESLDLLVEQIKRDILNVELALS